MLLYNIFVFRQAEDIDKYYMYYKKGMIRLFKKINRINLLISVDAIIGSIVALLRYDHDQLAVYNYITFIVIVYLYFQTKRRALIPFFIFELFVFGSILILEIFPELDDSKNVMFNNIMIGIGSVGFVYIFSIAIRILWSRK